MGYTHYFRQKLNIDKAAWAAFCDDVKLIFADPHCEPFVCKESDLPDEPPEVTEEYVIFNGKGSDGYETFFVKRRNGPDAFSFCKTAQKPYDTAVVAVLIAMAVRFADAFNISSDGDAPDWEHGLDVYNRACNGRMTLDAVNNFLNN